MMIHGEVGALPPGVAVAARRNKSGDMIVVVVAEASIQRAASQPGVLVGLFCNALNRLLVSPDDLGPVTVREPLRLVS